MSFPTTQIPLSTREPAPLIAAVDWIQGVLLGTVATTTAVVAIAFTGLLMLRGRLPVRRGATVLLGCFILFGAASIASGLRHAAAGFPLQSAQPPTRQAAAASSIEPVLVTPSPTPATPDPYAGASLRR